MGRDKALLRLGRLTFLEHLVGVLHGEVAPLVVVLGHHGDEIEREISSHQPLHILRNPDYRLGQLSSLQVALRFLEGKKAEAALVCLVDHPAITQQVVRRLLERFYETAAPILIPTHQGRRGHPVLFSRSMFPELFGAPLQEGARFVVRRHEKEVEFVEMDDEGILLDIDRPEDYESLQKRWEELSAADGKPPQEPS